ncbi:transcriptional regulator [Pseudanabaena sp. UWO311]|uniref:helix-turn-helix domain-containing protein n=1 Tax=Pseudanabaena sp. UWO311 TaxID=2487337 RepID=UPI001156D382|nr:transcriptional regulator [Pseudanabaena sp. UWO311]TYQ23493.1 transcriptional regulator [Pseudanabaena sp. UWO311]
MVKDEALLADIQPRVITTEEENDRALGIVEGLLAEKNLSPEKEQILQLLVSLIEKFEDEHYQLAASTPHSILLHLMEQRGLRQTDLIGLIGSRGVVSEVVNGKRTISKSQAKSLGEFFHVDPSLFIDF